MARIIAIDYGTKKCGIATTDPLQIIVTGLTTVKEAELLSFLQEYIRDENVEKIIIGHPIHLDGTPTFLSTHIKGLIKNLHKIFPNIEVELHDESYSSSKAKSIIAQSGAKKKKRQRKDLIDKISAVVILQDYLGHI